ncbi:hypothetical protein D9C73_005981 [Collichthys lucidus]|uniref:Uncharacterized protein n=1 Tax=Collichthys lucidus TaxID=240159 RepID=A0A4U5U9P4_COLLU|nr:hypothetical protein D9C73_005981 [Collichthys lucidus]
METIQELIPLAKEILSQKTSRGLLKVYLAMDAEIVLMMAREQRTVEAETQCSVGGQEEEEDKEEELAHKNGATNQTMTLSKIQRLSQRSMANRLHAS